MAKSVTYYLNSPLSGAFQFKFDLENEADARPLIDLLLSKKADIMAVDDGGETPLHKAARSDNAIIVQHLVLISTTILNSNFMKGFTFSNQNVLAFHVVTSKMCWKY